MTHTKKKSTETDPFIAEEILQSIKDIQFGSVEIIIHDYKVVQIERKEKRRFEKKEFSHPSKTDSTENSNKLNPKTGH